MDVRGDNNIEIQCSCPKGQCISRSFGGVFGYYIQTNKLTKDVLYLILDRCEKRDLASIFEDFALHTPQKLCLEKAKVYSSWLRGYPSKKFSIMDMWALSVRRNYTACVASYPLSIWREIAKYNTDRRLVFAIRCAHKLSIEKILEHADFITGVDDRGNHYIHHVAASKFSWILKLLLDDMRIPVISDNKNALVVAIEAKREENVKLLLEDRRCNPNTEEKINCSVRTKNVNILKLVVGNRRVNPIHLEEALRLAAELSFILGIEYILSNSNVKGEWVVNAFEASVKEHHVDASILIMEDARFNWNDVSKDAIDSICKIQDHLLTQKAVAKNLNCQTVMDLFCHYALRRNYTKLINYLIQKQTVDISRFLGAAIHKRKLELIEYLLKNSLWTSEDIVDYISPKKNWFRIKDNKSVEADIFKEILQSPKFDANAKDNQIIKAAINEADTRAARIFLQDERAVKGVDLGALLDYAVSMNRPSIIKAIQKAIHLKELPQKRIKL